MAVEGRKWSLLIAAAVAFILLACPIAITDADAGSNYRGSGYRGPFFRQRLPPRAPAPKQDNTSKTQPSKVDGDDKSAARNEPKNNDKSQRDDDDDDGSQTDDNRAGQADGRAVRAGVDDEAIPSTVVGLVKRLLAPPARPLAATHPERRERPGGVRAEGGPGVGEAAKLLPAKPLRKLTGRHTGNLPLKLPSMRGTDVLVRNLSSTALGHVLARGLTVESRRDLGGLGYSLTRLLAPPGMSAADVKALLQEASPQAAINLNQRYRLFPSARGEDGSGPRPAAEPARSTGGCASERCYGAVAIGWQSQLSRCASGMRVGVIDTGIDSTHPSLAQQSHRIKFGRFGPGYKGAGSDLHGTGVLALLAGSSRSSTPGLIPGARFYVADIFFADENGLPVSTTLHLLEALEWMDRLQVQVINLSLSGPRDDLVQAAIARMSKPRTVDGATRSAVVFVAAAGNGGPGAPPSYPAAYPDAVAVTAVSKDLRGYRRANQGDYIDVAAPGVDIWTALPDGRQGYQTGTSFATPYMTAVVASLYRTLPSHRIRAAMLERISVQDLGPPGRDRIYGRGLVQAPFGCDPASPWTPAVVSRAPPTRPFTQKTASR